MWLLALCGLFWLAGGWLVGLAADSARQGVWSVFRKRTGGIWVPTVSRSLCLWKRRRDDGMWDATTIC